MSMNNVLPSWVVMMPVDPKERLAYIKENKYGIPEHVRQKFLKEAEKDRNGGGTGPY